MMKMNLTVGLAVLLARHDMNHENWATVAWSRSMLATAKDLGIPNALTDVEGRPIVDAIPSDHSDHGGQACDEGLDGCCVVCGVSMERCDACGGIGYHKDDCEESDVYESEPATLRSFVVAQVAA